MHLPTFKWTLSFLYETIAKKKDMKYFALIIIFTNDNYKVVKRKLVVHTVY